MHYKFTKIFILTLSEVVGFGWTGFNKINVVVLPVFFLFLTTTVSSHFLFFWSFFRSQIRGVTP